MKRLTLIVCMCLFSWASHAEITPPKGEFDPRIRRVDHNPFDVVKIPTFFGVSTHIEFSKDEVIDKFSMGDDKGWIVRSSDNHLFFQPIAVKADTNATVITTKRTYHFALVINQRNEKDATAWADENLVFSLSFRYPREETARTDDLHWKEDVKARLANAESIQRNHDYWVAGHEEISPTAAHDDGRFIYLGFGANKPIPAVYYVNSVGEEENVNKHVKGNVLVVQRMAAQLMLRKGNLVASVINRSFDASEGIDNTTGTIADDVQRVTQGENQ